MYFLAFNRYGRFCILCDSCHVCPFFNTLVHYARDYKAEAAKVLAELPDDYHLREDSRAYDQQRHNFFDI